MINRTESDSYIEYDEFDEYIIISHDSSHRPETSLHFIRWYLDIIQSKCSNKIIYNFTSVVKHKVGCVHTEYWVIEKNTFIHKVLPKSFQIAEDMKTPCNVLDLFWNRAIYNYAKTKPGKILDALDAIRMGDINTPVTNLRLSDLYDRNMIPEHIMESIVSRKAELHTLMHNSGGYAYYHEP